MNNWRTTQIFQVCILSIRSICMRSNKYWLNTVPSVTLRLIRFTIVSVYIQIYISYITIVCHILGQSVVFVMSFLKGYIVNSITRSCPCLTFHIYVSICLSVTYMHLSVWSLVSPGFISLSIQVMHW